MIQASSLWMDGPRACARGDGDRKEALSVWMDGSHAEAPPLRHPAI